MLVAEIDGNKHPHFSVAPFALVPIFHNEKWKKKKEYLTKLKVLWKMSLLIHCMLDMTDEELRIDSYANIMICSFIILPLN